MRAIDLCAFAATALKANWVRTALIVCAMAIGVSSVLVLTALGEGANRFVRGQFASLGSNLLIVLPGRSETVGGPPPLFGATPRDLSLDDAAALGQHPSIRRIAPIIVGAAPVSTSAGLEREVSILGSTSDMAAIRHLRMGKGNFLPSGDTRLAASVIVLGFELASELFGTQSPLGHWVRVGDRRFRVIGVIAASGVSIGVDFDDIAIVPVAAAAALFNRDSLFRVLAEVKNGAALDVAKNTIRRLIAARHEGEDDVTVIAQDSVVKTLGKVLTSLTVGVGAISAISLAVAGILIMNVMLVSVTQRRSEIGLLKALGARLADVRRLFVVEALLLASVGATTGLVIGRVATAIIAKIYPQFPVAIPLWSYLAAALVAMVTGLVFGAIPARRAAALDPIAALSQR